MKRILILLVILVANTTFSLAQWNVSGTHIYNTNTGNVGIGTTTPTSRFEVSGSTFNRISGIVTANVENNFTLQRTGASFPTKWEVYIPASSTDLRFYNAGDRITFLANGNVGIGTTNPLTKLHLVDGRGRVENATESSIQYIATSPAQNWDVGTNSYGYYFYDGNSGSYKMVINKNGNIGIGTTDPKTFRLAVNGKVWATEVQVALTIPGPDYVFEQSYNLPSLTDTENYIKQNKHLPEVPSACEMETNGVNLSEMNMILLKKVEELTLYIINQEKRIAELEKSKK